MICRENFCLDLLGQKYDCCDYDNQVSMHSCNFDLNQYRCRAGDGICNSNNDCLGEEIYLPKHIFAFILKLQMIWCVARTTVWALRIQAWTLIAALTFPVSLLEAGSFATKWTNRVFRCYIWRNEDLKCFHNSFCWNAVRDWRRTLRYQWSVQKWIGLSELRSCQGSDLSRG